MRLNWDEISSRIQTVYVTVSNTVATVNPAMHSYQVYTDENKAWDDMLFEAEEEATSIWGNCEVVKGESSYSIVDCETRQVYWAIEIHQGIFMQ